MGRRKKAVADSPKGSDGYTYFIQVGDDGPIKIGQTSSPEARIRAIDAFNPSKLNVLLVIKCRGHERALHVRFAQHRLKGEWFAPAPEILAVIDELRSQATATGEQVDPSERGESTRRNKLRDDAIAELFQALNRPQTYPDQLVKGIMRKFGITEELAIQWLCDWPPDRIGRAFGISARSVKVVLRRKALI
jgi:hypothetical protein